MSKKKKSKGRAKVRERRSIPPDLQLAAESRTALSVTVAWTLVLMSTLAAEGIGFLCQLYTRFVGVNELLTVLGAVMLFVALVAGFVTLLLTPLVLKIAQTRPPTLIVQIAYVAGILPIVVLTLQYVTGQR